MNAKQVIANIVENANITLNGDEPWDIQVHDERFYKRVIREGTLGLGETYMDGWWDSQDLEETIYRLVTSNARERLPKNPIFMAKVGLWRLQYRMSSTTKHKSFEVGEQHYNLGNDLFKQMLDTQMIYSCGYWKDADNLDQAQEYKMDLICRKLGLQQGMRVLDIGCGWGGFLKYAAENYGIEGVGVTISTEQADMARRNLEGLPGDIWCMDYRDISSEEKFDAVVSIGMFEHVGYKQYRTYMKKVNEVLTDDGLSLIHTIGANDPETMGEPWITKYIFPNSNLPAIEQIDRASRDMFVMEDWHNFGPYYTTTLRSWFSNFNAVWPEFKDIYGDRFYRMWTYYLRSTAAVFRARGMQLWQIVHSKFRKRVYSSVR